MTYPVTVGQNVEEILRLVTALQATDSVPVVTPEGWRPGEPVLTAPPQTFGEALAAAEEGGASWYYRLEGLRDE